MLRHHGTIKLKLNIPLYVEQILLKNHIYIVIKLILAVENQ